MTKKIFIIAGEASGDALGAGLIRALKEETGGDVHCMGVGGPLMEKEGFESLLPMDELCVMGIFEIVWQLPRLLKLINGLVDEIEEAEPDVLVTIDLPDFNFQVGSRLKKRAQGKTKVIHYVAPTVWAWREKRAEKISLFLDGLMCLFPFEPKYFEKHKLPSEFVGHPMIEHELDGEEGARFRQEFDIDPDQKILGLFMGSRQRELDDLSSTLREAADIVREQHPDILVIIPTLPHLEFHLRELLTGWDMDPMIVSDVDKKWEAMDACDVALAVSGTVALELAYMRVPHAIGYKMNQMSSLIVRFLVKIKNAHLANILLEKDAIPEHLQHNFTSRNLSRELLKLLKLEDVREKQMIAFEELHTLMEANSEITPSQRAARFVLKYITK